jgi:hypothetical protein
MPNENDGRFKPVVKVPFTEREFVIPQPIMIPLVPVWKGLYWFAHKVDGVARRVVEDIRNIPGWRR